MTAPPARRTRRGTRPTVSVEFRASRRLQVAWHGWCGLLAVVLLAGLGWPWWGRCIAVAILAGLWRHGRDWLAYPGTGARRLIWDEQGGWWLQDLGRGLQPLRLAAMPHALGPWLWLHFRGPTGADLTLIDARYAEPVGLCRLKAALRVEFRRLELEVHNG